MSDMGDIYHMNNTHDTVSNILYVRYERYTPYVSYASIEIAIHIPNTADTAGYGIYQTGTFVTEVCLVYTVYIVHIDFPRFLMLFALQQVRPTPLTVRLGPSFLVDGKFQGTRVGSFTCTCILESAHSTYSIPDRV